MLSPKVELRNAHRAALVCLTDPDEFAPAYLQIALERMLNALVQITPSVMEDLKFEQIEEPALQTLLYSYATHRWGLQEPVPTSLG